MRQTTITISCTSPVDLNQASTCTVTVTDGSPGVFAGPGGAVSFASSITTSSFSGSGTCQLAGSGSSSSCKITYTQNTSTASPDIAATYQGDPDHNTSAVHGTAKILNPPELSVPGPQTVAAGSTVRFIVNATDGSKTVTLTASGLPPGATFSSTQSFAGGTSSIFQWTPPDAQAPGDYNVTFTARDTQGASTISQVTIHVNPVSKAPPLPIISYSIFGVLGFFAIVGAALLIRRLQAPKRMSKA